MKDALNDEELGQLTHKVFQVLREWHLEHDEQVTLLGLPETMKPRHLTRHHEGEPLPREDETLARMERLLSIEHELVCAFPHNPNMAALWVTTPSRLFNDARPLDLMLEKGVAGMTEVLEHLRGGSDSWR
jgi:uncharacterized protein (DUF2384 family)